MGASQELDLLEWHSTGQLALIDVATKAVKNVGAPAMWLSVDLSPNGQFIRTTRQTRPFSYIVPVSNFGTVEEVIDLAGAKLAQITERKLNLGQTAADDPTADPAAQAAGGGGGRGGGANLNGKRDLAWRTDGAGFTYLEREAAPAGSPDAAGGGRAGRGAAGGGRGAAAAGGGTNAPQGPPRKDRVMQWLPPFNDTSTKLVYENATTMSGHRYSPDMTMLFYSETAGQNTTVYAVNLAEPATRYPVSQTRGGGAGGRAGGGAAAGADADPNTPGTLVSARGGGGGGRGGGGARGGGAGGGGPVLVSADKSAVFLEGTVYDKNPDAVGPKTFVDRVTIKTGEKARIFEGSNQDQYETVSTILDPDAKTFIISRQSPTETPQSFLVTGATRKQLTQNTDIAPDLTKAPKLRIPITRPDGFHFTVRVTMPVGWTAGQKMPAIFWVYPSEYETQEAHDRTDRTFNKNTFTNFGSRSMEFFIRQGYAVLEDAPDHLPIVGPAGRMNDNYVDDLRNDLAAVIDELDRRGIIDRDRLAIGGHSYGAFTTVNAMVNTPFFKAGIAGDGNYNRTLTPFSFQSERRTFWEAPNVYLNMSPFMRADHLTGALLMYHNMHDQNVGTDPINSDRLFEALNQLGKTASLYKYPYEDHGPVAKETLLDMWARWGAWLDKYVKNPAPVVKPAPGPRGGGGGK
jgi:dienelactone hydrolase